MTKNKFAVKRGAHVEEIPADEREKTNVPQEKSEEAAEKERADFENERRSYIAEKLEFHAKKTLTEENLPASFAKLLCGEDEEETVKNIALFKEEFLRAVEAALSERLKGSTPKTAAPSNEFDPFLTGFSN